MYNRPFCDGHHIVQGKARDMSVQFEMGLRGEFRACFLSTCGETGHLSVPPLLY